MILAYARRNIATSRKDVVLLTSSESRYSPARSADPSKNRHFCVAVGIRIRRNNAGYGPAVDETALIARIRDNRHAPAAARHRDPALSIETTPCAPLTGKISRLSVTACVFSNRCFAETVMAAEGSAGSQSTADQFEM